MSCPLPGLLFPLLQENQYVIIIIISCCCFCVCAIVNPVLPCCKWPSTWPNDYPTDLLINIHTWIWHSKQWNFFLSLFEHNNFNCNNNNDDDDDDNNNYKTFKPVWNPNISSIHFVICILHAHKKKNDWQKALRRRPLFSKLKKKIKRKKMDTSFCEGYP